MLHIRSEWIAEIKRRCIVLRINPPRYLDYMTGAELSACNRALLAREARAGMFCVLPGTAGWVLAQRFGDTDILNPPPPEENEDQRFARCEQERQRAEGYISVNNLLSDAGRA